LKGGPTESGDLARLASRRTREREREREMVELPELENEILAGEVYDEVSGSGETESGTRRCESGS